MTDFGTDRDFSEKTVSVVIPVFNCEKYIEETVSSVLRQTFSNFEIIIVNDASTDRTPEILQGLKKKDERIKVIDQQENMGVAQARNKAFEYCRGDFIALLDADDFWFETKLQKQLELQEKTDADLVYCSYAIINESGDRICKDFIVPETTDLQRTLEQSIINCSTALFKTELVSRIRFKEVYYHEDLIFWIDLLRSGIKACGTQQVLAAYRQVQGSRASDKLKSAVNRYRILRQYLHMPLMKSYAVMIRYAVKAFRKYKRKSEINECTYRQS